MSCIPVSLSEQWATLRRHLAREPPSKLWPTLKTLAGAWTTSYRMHVNPHKFSCLLGCPSHESKRNIDDISHYLTCPRLWTHVCQPRGVVSAHLLTRMGLNGDIDDGENDIRHAIARLAVAFKTYNFLRIQHSQISSVPSSVTELRAVGTVIDSYDKNSAAVAASRRALRLPSCLVGGAGPRGRP